jgi:hypothetical protein
VTVSSTGSFAGRARAATGAGPTHATEPYQVSVAGGALALLLEATGSPVLRAPLDHVRSRPLGRAGAVVVEVDGAPVLVDFTERKPGSGPTHAVRRAARALRGRAVRRAFLAATRTAR